MSKSSVVRELVLKTYTEMETRFTPGISQNRKMAVFWGGAHIAIGLLTAICSTLSAALTFSSNQALVVAFSLLSATLAASLTFLNPSAREGKRRTSEYLIRAELNRLRQDRIFIMASTTTEGKMMDRLETTTKRFEALPKELIGFL